MANFHETSCEMQFRRPTMQLQHFNTAYHAVTSF